MARQAVRQSSGCVPAMARHCSAQLGKQSRVSLDLDLIDAFHLIRPKILVARLQIEHVLADQLARGVAPFHGGVDESAGPGLR